MALDRLSRSLHSDVCDSDGCCDAVVHSTISGSEDRRTRAVLNDTSKQTARAQQHAICGSPFSFFSGGFLQQHAFCGCPFSFFCGTMRFADLRFRFFVGTMRFADLHFRFGRRSLRSFNRRSSSSMRPAQGALEACSAWRSPCVMLLHH